MKGEVGGREGKTYAENEGEETEDVRVEEEVVAPRADEGEGEDVDDVGTDETDETSHILRLSELGCDLACCGPFVNCPRRVQSQRREKDEEKVERTVSNRVDVDGEDGEAAGETVKVVQLRLNPSSPR